MKSLTTTTATIIAVLCALTVAACSDSAQREDGVARETAGAIKDAGREVGDAAAGAARAAGDAVLNGGRAADAAFETADVKGALIADSRLSANGINVDTDHTAKLIILRGQVPTAEQKMIAGEIAAKRAVGYQVQNDLAVR